jgi:outer membrane protein TolC
MNLKNFISLCALTLAIASCYNGQGGKLAAKKANVGAKFLNNGDVSSAAPIDEWWRQFNDATLNEIIEIALQKKLRCETGWFGNYQCQRS